MHDKEHQGLQKERIGDDYPWTIARIGDQYWQPIHCITGEKGPKYRVGKEYADYDRDRLLTAHRKAELWIAEQLEGKIMHDNAAISPIVATEILYNEREREYAVMAYRSTERGNIVRYKRCDYFTDDKQDAYDTADAIRSTK